MNMSVVNDNEVTNLAETRLGLLVRKALQIREAAAQFDRDWPRLANRPSMPGFAWTELERQLMDLAPDALSPMVRDLVSAVRKEAGPKPPEMVLREILIVTATLLDEGFRTKWHEAWAEGTSMS